MGRYNIRVPKKLTRILYFENIRPSCSNCRGFYVCLNKLKKLLIIWHEVFNKINVNGRKKPPIKNRVNPNVPTYIELICS